MPSAGLRRRAPGRCRPAGPRLPLPCRVDADGSFAFSTVKSNHCVGSAVLWRAEQWRPNLKSAFISRNSKTLICIRRGAFCLISSVLLLHASSSRPPRFTASPPVPPYKSARLHSPSCRVYQFRIATFTDSSCGSFRQQHAHEEPAREYALPYNAFVGSRPQCMCMRPPHA